MEPGDHISNGDERPAVIMATCGLAVTYRELDARSKQLAQLFYDRGLHPGDHIAILLENHPRYFEVYWAAQRSGLYSTPINWYLTPAESGYIIEDCVRPPSLLRRPWRPLHPSLSPTWARSPLGWRWTGRSTGAHRTSQKLLAILRSGSLVRPRACICSIPRVPRGVRRASCERSTGRRSAAAVGR